MRHKLHPLSILKHSYKFSAANILGYLLQIPSSIYVASRLGPENYGLVAFVMLWAFYGRLIRPGLFNATAREMPHCIGKGNADRAIFIRNVAATYEFIYYLLAGVIIVAASFFFKNPIIKTGLILVAVSLILETIHSAFASEQWAFQRFGIMAKITVLRTITTPLITVLLVYLFHTYGVLILMVALPVICILCFLFIAPKVKLKAIINYKEFRSLFKVGIALQFFGFLFWAIRGVDRTYVAMYFSAAQLGFYSFAMSPIHNIYNIISDFGKVLSPVIYNELSKSEDSSHMQREIARLVILLTLAGCIITNLAQAGFGGMVLWFIPKFAPSIKIFEVFAFNIIFTAMLAVPTILLVSTMVNKQKVCNIIYGVILAVSFLLVYFISRANAGVIAIAYIFVGIYFLKTLLIFLVSKKYIFKNNHEFLLFIFWAAAILTTSLVNYLCFSMGPFKFSSYQILFPLITRICLTLACWGAVSFLMYKYIIKDKRLLSLIKERIVSSYAK